MPPASLRFVDAFQLASLASFIVIFIARAAHLYLAGKINPIAIGRGKKGFDLAFELTAFSGLILWMMAVVLHATGAKAEILDAQWMDSVIMRTIGEGLVVLAIATFALAFLSLGNSWRVGFDRQTPGKLITTGTFAFSRNPIYVALDLWFVGIALINGTWLFLAFAAIAALALHCQMLREEEFCADLYGEAYQAYRARTGRYFSLKG